jgi:type III secretory pathway lipoprotein EscJ
MEKNWIKIYKSANFYQSEIVKQMLQQHHIEAVLLNKQDSSYRNFGNVEVYVHQEDFDHAIELLILNQIDHL